MCSIKTDSFKSNMPLSEPILELFPPATIYAEIFSIKCCKSFIIAITKTKAKTFRKTIVLNFYFQNMLPIILQ